MTYIITSDNIILNISVVITKESDNVKNFRFNFKEPVNTLTHLTACILAIFGTIYLILSSTGELTKLLTLGIYGLSLITLYGASSLYHGTDTTPEKEQILKKIDHVAIFFLIAGSYTPVFSYGLPSTWRIIMLTLVWSFAVLGMIIKVLYVNVPRWVSSVIYVSLGWIALIPFYQLVRTFPLPAIALMVLGGLAYTFGAVIYATKWFDFIPNKFGFHENFHIWTMIGSLIHFIFIAVYIL